MKASVTPPLDGGVIAGPRARTSADIQARALRAASGFDAAGIGPGDRIALLLRNDIALFEASLAATALGAYPVPINWHCRADEIAYILKDCAARALVVHRDLCTILPPALSESLLLLVVETPPDSDVAHARPDEHEPATPALRRGLDWEHWLAVHEPWSGPARLPTGSVVYTSGTTGRPKAVVRPPMSQSQVEAAHAMVRAMFGFCSGEALRTVITGPLYHTAPNSYALTALRFGGFLVLQPRFDAQSLLRLIAQHRISHLHVVPTMFVRLLRLPEAVRRAADVSSLRWVAHGAAPCAPAVKQAMIDWWGPVINEYYGSTETGGITVQTSADARVKPGSVGRPLPGVEICVCDAQQRALPPGTTGDIYVRTSALADFQYLGDPEKRLNVARGPFVCVGDIGHLDVDGYLFLSDRRADIINSGGVKIYSAEVEAVLLEIEGVEDCAVIGIPDEEYGEAVCAHVVPARSAVLTEAGVQRHLRARLSGFKLPKHIVLVDSLPREDTGKVLKRRIREQYWQHSQRRI